jgi:hypothetical protein
VAPSHLRWEGCFNVRDLGGLPVAGGGRIRPGALVRADAVAARGTTGAALVAGLVRGGGFEAALRAGGLADGDLAALRERLVEPA